MIDRVNQKPFLLWQAEAVVKAGEGPMGPELPAGERPPSKEELAAARELLAAAILEEKAKPLTPAQPPGDERRGEKPVPVELLSYMPRSVPLSLVQSALDRYFMEYRREDLSDLRTDPERRTDRVAGLANFELEIDDEEIPALKSDDRRIARAFEKTDVRWVSALVAIGLGKLRKRKGFPPEPAPPRELDDDARVVIVGDWASGLDRAVTVAAQMRKAIEAATQADRQCHVIHLGDTYYGGWAREYEKRFLPHWPVETGEKDRIGSWSLPGNHDMYTGGHGYYDVLLEDERFKPYHQGSSRFSLENDHWQLLGLDTAFEDHALHGGQVDWVERKLAEKNPGRRTMLLSHHQPFSAYNDGGGRLSQDLRGPLGAGLIDAWLWGHEHRCALYKPLPHLAFPCCVGHGGVPVGMPGRRPDKVKWHLDRGVSRFGGALAFFGFAVLDFDGPEITVSFIGEDNHTDHQETIR